MVDGIIVRVTKICKGCGVEKPIDEFDFEPRVRDQRTARCSACLRAKTKAWSKENPEKMVSHRQKYRDTHRERDKASRAAAAKRNTERRQEVSALARIEKGLWPIPPRALRYSGNQRLCTDCRQYKEPSEFSPSGNTADRLFSYCKPCAAARAKASRKLETAEQRERRRIYDRRYSSQRLYGIPYSEVERLFAEQNGLCKICQCVLDLDVPRTDPKGAGIDHCHATKKVRGILCIKCNAGLGQFRDNEDYLMAAIEYLRRS